jgi:hypothetical protein
MVPLVLLVRFVVVQHSPGVEHPLSSTFLTRVARVALVECDNFMKPDIVRLSTGVRTTRC